MVFFQDMQDFRKGFVGLLAVVFIGLVLIGGGSLLYLSKNQNETIKNETPTISVGGNNQQEPISTQTVKKEEMQTKTGGEQPITQGISQEDTERAKALSLMFHLTLEEAYLADRAGKKPVALRTNEEIQVLSKMFGYTTGQIFLMTPQVFEEQRMLQINAHVETVLHDIQVDAEFVSIRDNESYSQVCSGPSATPTASIHNKIQELASILRSNVICKSTKTAWVVQSPILPSGYWCSDSKGNWKSETVALGDAELCR